MLQARLIVEEYDEQNGGTLQEDWGAYTFASAPAAGDMVRVGRDDMSHDIKVLRLLHMPGVSGSEGEPLVYIIGER